MAKFFFGVFMDRDEVEVHKLAKKERGQYPAILTKQTWSIKDLLWLLGKFCLRDIAGSPERARWFHLARSGSQSQRAIWFILPARGASHIVMEIILWLCLARTGKYQIPEFDLLKSILKPVVIERFSHLDLHLDR